MGSGGAVRRDDGREWFRRACVRALGQAALLEPRLGVRALLPHTEPVMMRVRGHARVLVCGAGDRGRGVSPTAATGRSCGLVAHLLGGFANRHAECEEKEHGGESRAAKAAYLPKKGGLFSLFFFSKEPGRVHSRRGGTFLLGVRVANGTCLKRSVAVVCVGAACSPPCVAVSWYHHYRLSGDLNLRLINTQRSGTVTSGILPPGTMPKPACASRSHQPPSQSEKGRRLTPNVGWTESSKRMR